MECRPGPGLVGTPVLVTTNAALHPPEHGLIDALISFVFVSCVVAHVKENRRFGIVRVACGVRREA